MIPRESAGADARCGILFYGFYLARRGALNRNGGVSCVLKKKFFNAGTEVFCSSLAERAAAVGADMTAMARLIKAAGIRAV